MRSVRALVTGLLAAKACAQNLTADNSSLPVTFALSTDTEFSFQLQGLLSTASGFGSSTGEVLRAASRITAGDIDSFYTEFNFLANSIHEIAVEADKAGHLASARDAYFRAATYYRAADFFIHHNKSDPRLTALWTAQLADFGKAIRLLPVPGERVELHSASNYTIPAYFFPAAAGKGGSCGAAAPTVVVGTGFDGAQEDVYHQICVRVLQRGYNCLTYEGPGQPTVVHMQGLGFTPDWWEVVTPVLDYARSRADVDNDRIALAGVSFGGQLAPLATAHEDRFAALLLIDGIYSLYDTIYDELPATMQGYLDNGNQTDFDELSAYLYANDIGGTSLRWGFDQGLFAFATDSYYDWLHQLKTFDLNSTFLATIAKPVFVGSGQNDTQAPGQAPVVWSWLNETAPSSSTYHLFLDSLGAGLHCQIGAESQLVQASMDWLSGIFASVGK